MKLIQSFLLLLSLSSFAAPARFIGDQAGATAKESTSVGVEVTETEKAPKSLFLIKKIQISSDVGEPQFNSQRAQLRTVINDSLLHNTKKFE